MSHSNGPTLLERARAYFKAPGAKPLTAFEAAEMFGCTVTAMRHRVLSILRYEGVVYVERRAGAPALYWSVAP